MEGVGPIIYNELIPEDQLKAISRNIRKFFPHDPPSDDQLITIKGILKGLYNSCVEPDLSTTHRVAAWNTLCAWVDQCSSTAHDGIRQLVHRSELWFILLSLYLKDSQHARPKSSKQLLSSLSSLWLKCDGFQAHAAHFDQQVVKCFDKGNHGIGSCNADLAQTLIGIFYDEGSGRMYKAGLQATTHFLLKDVLTIEDLVFVLNGNAPPESFNGVLQGLLLVLIERSTCDDVGSASGQLINVILDKHGASERSIESQGPNGERTTEQQPVWAKPLQAAVEEEGIQLDELRLHIFPVLFKRSLAHYLSFLKANGLYTAFSADQKTSNNDCNEELLFAALQSGKELGLVHETGDDRISSTSTMLQLPVSMIGRLLCRSSRSARLAGLYLLISSHSAARPLPADTFRLLRRNLHLFMGDTDANFRGEVVSMIQRLLDRLRAASAYAHKHVATTAGVAGVVQHTRGFIEWLFRFLVFELRPTASYQHHISALKVLLVMAKSGLDTRVPLLYLSKASARAEARWPFEISICNELLSRSLLELLFDPFEDVRQTSSILLGFYDRPIFEPDCDSSVATLRQIISRAENDLQTSGRADHADGVAYLYVLLYRESGLWREAVTTGQSPSMGIFAHFVQDLGVLLKVANRDLMEATHQYPLHGALTTLRYLLTSTDLKHELRQLPQPLVDALHQVWEAVRSVLCNDAPEGFSIDDDEEDLAETSKTILSYCWRALKESSLLLGSIILHRSTSDDQILYLSRLCFNQLAELRHRGGFSTVAQTWVTCCLRCRNMDNTNGQPILEEWYGQVLQIMRGQMIINTRRSAGLPSLICGLLIAQPSTSLIARTIDDLSNIARMPVDPATQQDSSLPQVHALNCIKDILKNSRLGEQSERHIPHALRLAADSLRSDAWAVRNCGLMLFRAVIDRLLGTSDAHLDDNKNVSTRIAATQHYHLIDVVADILKDTPGDAGSTHSEGIFPALQLLQYTNFRVNGADERSEIEGAVFALTAHTSWHIRAKAAQVYATFVTAHGHLDKIEAVLDAVTVSHNALHGALLCLKHLAIGASTSRRRSLPSQITISGHTIFNRVDRVAQLLKKSNNLAQYYDCPVIPAAWIDAEVEVGRQKTAGGLADEPSSEDDAVEYLSVLRQKMATALDMPAGIPGVSLLRRTLARAIAFYLCRSRNIYLEEESELKSLIGRLGHEDANACCTFFEELQASLSSSKDPYPGALRVAFQPSAKFDVVKSSLELKCAIQSFMLWAHAHGLVPCIMESTYTDVVGSPTPSDLSPNPTPEVDLVTGTGHADLRLQLHGVHLDVTMARNGGIGNPLAIHLWRSLCCLAFEEEQASPYSREAAAHALHRTYNHWKWITLKGVSPHRRVCLAVYDMLNDDDEDIRLLGCEIVARNIAGYELPPPAYEVLEPAQARVVLVKGMMQRWEYTYHFAQTALWRAFPFLEHEPSSDSVAEQFDEATATDRTLFAEEKQNLYLDEATEVKFWTDVLLCIDESAFVPRLLAKLLAWASWSLDEFIVRAQREPRAQLGWDGKAEMFVLGLQVICAMEVLFRMCREGRVRVSEADVLLEKLVELAEVLEGRWVNALWKRELQRVLEGAIWDRMKQRVRFLQRVSRAIACGWAEG